MKIKSFFAAGTLATASIVAPVSAAPFSDVAPTQWAYQAIQSLNDTYGCLKGYPNGTLKPAQFAQRDEMVALTNACLDSIVEFQTVEDAKLGQALRTQANALAGVSTRVTTLERTAAQKAAGVGNYLGAAVLLNQQGVDGPEYTAERTVAGGTIQGRYAVKTFANQNAVSVRPYVNFVAGPDSQIGAGGGGLLDMSGNNVNADLTNVAFDSTGYIFNGSSNYIDLGSDVIFKTSGGWSVSSWFNLTQVNSGNLYNFIGASAITYNSWYWTVYQSKLALYNLSPGAWYYGSTTILANTWYNAVLVCSYDGTRYQMYLNGIAEGGTHATYTWNADYSGLKIGYIGRGDSSNGRYFYGKYPNFQVYNKELTAAEVLQNFNATRTTYGI